MMVSTNQKKKIKQLEFNLLSIEDLIMLAIKAGLQRIIS